MVCHSGTFLISQFMNLQLSFVISICITQSLMMAATIDYNRDIRPILAENCFSCHGFDEKTRKAKLRMDVQESAFGEFDGLTPLKPGDLKGSEAWLRIVTEDEDELMPPPESQLKLTEEDKAKIKAWIEQGAKYAGHWSFITPKRPQISQGSGNAIDALVRQRLADEGLAPSPQADPATLIRRVSLDLTGLPPGAEEVDAFLKDTSPVAYEALVERLLKSPHFGERMALEWMDAARFADTNGFSIDGGRVMWLWRDWVIQAFNDNKPYDRFLIEQLAGDLLPNRTEADLIATGFQRNNMVTHEGGTLPEENLTNYNADRVKTLGESLLGLTLGCAQCHNHKFDPITQRDYYQMFAFFNSLSDRGIDGDGGVNPGPFVMAKTVIKTEEVPVLQSQIAVLKEALSKPDAKTLGSWEKHEREKLNARGKELKLHPTRILKISTPNSGSGFEIDCENGVRLSRVADLAAYDVSMQLLKINEPITGLRVVFHPDPKLPGGGWGNGPVERRARGKSKPALGKRSVIDRIIGFLGAQLGNGSSAPEAKDKQPWKGTFVLTSIAATAGAIANDQINLYKQEQIVSTTANSWDVKYPPADCLDPRNESGWSPNLATNGPVRLTSVFARPLNTADTPFLTVQLVFGHGKSLVPGHFEFFVITGNDDDSSLPAGIISILETADAKRSAAQQTELWNYCAANAKELQSTRVCLANLEERLAVLTQPFSTMVMDVAAKPRETFILNRGTMPSQQSR